MVGQPGTEPEPLPLSPHTRQLPPTRERGLWAAYPSDDPPLKPLLLGVELPYPPGADTEADKETTLLCAGAMADMALRPGVPEVDTRRWPEPVRRCVAARLYLKCAEGFEVRYQRQVKAGVLMDKEHEKRLRTARENAERFRAAACRDMSLPPEAEGFVLATGKQWEAEVSR